MTDRQKLWEILKKYRPEIKNPFETPMGPTKECLSANRTVSFVEGGEIDKDIVEHLKGCEVCRESLARFKSVR